MDWRRLLILTVAGACLSGVLTPSIARAELDPQGLRDGVWLVMGDMKEKVKGVAEFEEYVYGLVFFGPRGGKLDLASGEALLYIMGEPIALTFSIDGSKIELSWPPGMLEDDLATTVAGVLHYEGGCSEVTDVSVELKKDKFYIKVKPHRLFMMVVNIKAKVSATCDGEPLTVTVKMTGKLKMPDWWSPM